jgi:multiple sugar transport system substrate-binding protein
MTSRTAISALQRRRTVIAVALAAALMLSVAGCGGSDGDASESNGASSKAGKIKGAKVIDVNAPNGAKGTVTYCTGKDTDGDRIDGVKRFNDQFASQGLKAKLLEFPEAADEQRNQFIQRQRARSSECDVFESDVIWTAEFAQQKWLYDITPYLDRRKAEFLPSTLETVHYDGTYWGVPRQTDAAFLYYRTDQVKNIPSTWQQLYQEAAKTDGFAYQGAAYEGLTVVYLELAFAAGGKVLSDDGTKAEIDSPQNLKALQLMVDGLGNGAAPKVVTTYMEEPARRSFEAGRVTFMRNWPYAYALNQKAPKVKGKFKVMPFPTFEGGGKAGILGGHNMVVSAYSKNPGGALKLIDFFTSAETQKLNAIQYSKAPVLGTTYDDPEVQKALPFAPQLKQAVEQATSRPVSPVYSQISQAISKNINAALSGSTSPQDALHQANSQIDDALRTF